MTLAAIAVRAVGILSAAAIVIVVLFLGGAMAAFLTGVGFVLTAVMVARGRAEEAVTPGLPLSTTAAGSPSSLTLITAIIARIPDPVIVMDRQERVIAVNPAARALAPALRPNQPVVLGLRVPTLIDTVRRAIASGQQERAQFSQPVPTERWFELHVSPLDLDGAPDERLLMVTLHDLTPLRRIEEMRADFIANASHELRTPLAALSGFIETLEGAARDDPAMRARFLAIMKGQAGRMARLIDELLSLSRVELNQRLRPETPVDLVGAVRQVVDALQTLAHERGVEIAMTTPESPVVVLGDRDELLRVGENLIENALKYGASGKRVEITLGREPEVGDGAAGQAEAVLNVRDFGPGIAPEHLPRLTERFYRVDVGVSRAEGGTGLGLALVKHILNRHHGRLVIQSQVGQGATFTVRLPIAAESFSLSEFAK